MATHILAFEGDSAVDWFEGNYQAFHEHRRALLGDAADRPQRVRFRPVRRWPSIPCRLVPSDA